MQLLWFCTILYGRSKLSLGPISFAINPFKYKYEWKYPTLGTSVFIIMPVIIITDENSVWLPKTLCDSLPLSTTVY